MVGYSSYLTQIAGVVSKYIRSSTQLVLLYITDNAEESCGCWKYLDKNTNNFCLNCEFLFLTTNVPTIIPSREKLISC